MPLNSIQKLDKISTKLLLAKGLFIRSPNISHPDKVDFVQKQNYLGTIFGKQRPLNAIEITNL
jgi:hypothetical protein